MTNLGIRKRAVIVRSWLAIVLLPILQSSHADEMSNGNSDILPDDYIRLEQKRHFLDDELQTLKSAKARFESECGKVPRKDVARRNACETNQQDILSRMDLYDKALGEYESQERAAKVRGNVQKQILAKILADQGPYLSQLQRMQIEVDHLYVPVPINGREVHEGVILGLFDDLDRAQSFEAQSRSPFSGKEYRPGQVFASTDNTSSRELVRGFVDNQTLGDYTLNSDYGRRLVSSIRDTHFQRLIAHSNGATVAEALIRRGVITVDELNVMGGDRSLANLGGLQELIRSGKVHRVVVWVNPGDPIPFGSSAIALRDAIPSDRTITRESAFWARLLTLGEGNIDARVEVRSLTGSQYLGQEIHIDARVLESHGIDKYFENVERYLRH